MANKKFSLGIVLSAIDKVSAPLKGIQQKFKSFGDSVENQKSKLSLTSAAIGIPGLKKSFGNLGNSFSNVTDKIQGVATTLAVVGVAGAGAFALVKDSAEKLDNLGDLSKAIGINVKAIQEWRFAAQNAGSSTEEMDDGLRTFTMNMGKARAGGGKLLGFLKQANPAFSKQLLATKSNEEGFELMMNAISKVTDPQKRLALATMAFGSAGEGLARVSGEGAEKIAELRKEARKLGLATEEDTEKAGEFNDNMSKMVYALEAAKNTVALQLMPIMSEFFTKLKEWFTQNQGKVKEFARYLADNLPGAIQKVYGFFQQLANSPITKFFTFILEKIGYANAILISLSAYIGGVLIPAFISLGSALFTAGLAVTKVIFAIMFPALKALFALVLANPILAVITGIVAGGILIYKNWDKIKVLFSEIWDWIKKILSSGIEKIMSIFGGNKTLTTKTESENKNINYHKTLGAESLGAESVASQYFNNQQTKSTSEVKVSFDNLPKGTRVSSQKDKNASLDLSMGYSMVTP